MTEQEERERRIRDAGQVLDEIRRLLAERGEKRPLPFPFPRCAHFGEPPEMLPGRKEGNQQ